MMNNSSFQPLTLVNLYTSDRFQVKMVSRRLVLFSRGDACLPSGRFAPPQRGGAALRSAASLVLALCARTPCPLPDCRQAGLPLCPARNQSTAAASEMAPKHIRITLILTKFHLALLSLNIDKRYMSGTIIC